MANIKSFPNNQDEYRGAEDVMKWLHGRTSGVFAAENNAAVAAFVTPAMAVAVSDGIGWMSNSASDGVVWWNDHEKINGTKLQLDIDAADGVLNRIDRIIVEWATTTYVDYPEIKVLKGAASSTAVAPTLTNNSTLRQISLAQVSIPAGTTAITASMITDERLNPAVCGLVTETLAVDTSVVNAQFEELLARIQDNLQQIMDGQLADASITEAKIATDAVTTAKIATDAVTTAKIATGAVTKEKIAIGAVTKEKFGADVTALALGGVTITKLWQNASPTSSFEAQSINISNLQTYSKILVRARYSTTSNDGFMAMYDAAVGTTGSIVVSASYNGWRNFTLKSNGIQFDNASYRPSYGSGANTDSAIFIPVEIYGIKGVQ